jgi:hypothetical protein
MPHYFKVGDYLNATRQFVQDTVGPPYRYSDDTIVDTLNNAMYEIARVRPDVFLDSKWVRPLPPRAAPSDNIPKIFSVNNLNDWVPIPSTLFMAVKWYMAGLLQFYDVDDTQDARAAAFNQKFQGALMTLAV